jgi:predicted HNH restriction endonuclease
VPEEIARAIERESGKRIGIASDTYRVDSNSLRATGRITEDSAALFESLLDDTVVIRIDDARGEREGERHERPHMIIERSSRLRARALAGHGTDCRVCGFSFGASYGALGDGFAEVHHLAPLGTLTGSVLVDPEADVVVLCANCHRMVHRRNPPLTPDELQAAMSRF